MKKIIIILGIILSTYGILEQPKNEEGRYKNSKNIFKIEAKAISASVFMDKDAQEINSQDSAERLYAYLMNNDCMDLYAKNVNGTPIQPTVTDLKEMLISKSNSLRKEVEKHNKNNPNDPIDTPSKLYEKLCKDNNLN
jgi:hypothetical protein